jgi:hypothetical protein
MLDAGVDLRDVQIAARHADPRTTMHYDRAARTWTATRTTSSPPSWPPAPEPAAPPAAPGRGRRTALPNRGRWSACRLFSLSRLAWRIVEIRANRPFWLGPSSGLTDCERR